VTANTSVVTAATFHFLHQSLSLRLPSFLLPPVFDVCSLEFASFSKLTPFQIFFFAELLFPSTCFPIFVIAPPFMLFTDYITLLSASVFQGKPTFCDLQLLLFRFPYVPSTFTTPATSFLV